ncbi:MAG: MBOAT family protein, partial [Lachnospiraceae bacterium]|nr:MBOAT family protein [Lachnospiraceae bacterium]
MVFNSLTFLIFLPAVLAGYYLLPRRARTFWLLAASYVFYASWNVKYTALILISTGITYLSGLL